MSKGIDSAAFFFDGMFPADALDSIGDLWLTRWRASQQLRLRIALDMLTDVTLPDAADIMDVGCGQAIFLRKLVSRFPNSRFTGVDLSGSAIEWNRAHFPDISFIVDALPDLRSIAATFSLVSAMDVIYYMDDATRYSAIRRIHELLRDSGFLLLCSPIGMNRSGIRPELFIRSIERLFRPRSVEFVHNRLYAIAERPFLKLITLLWNIGPAGCLCGIHRRAALLLAHTLRPMFGPVCLAWISRCLAPVASRSHVVMLLEKKGI